jgi:hypothetical protein
MLEVNAQFLLAAANLLFGALAFGDVAANAGQSDDLAVGITIRSLGRQIGTGDACRDSISSYV